MNDSTLLKRCSKCKERFPATSDYFNKHKNTKDGLQYCCKLCSRAIYANWRLNNLERARKRSADWIRNNPEKSLDARRRWVNAHPERVRRIATTTRKRNRETAILQTRQWKKANPDKVRMAKLRYRTKKRSLPTSFTASQWRRCLEWFNYTCAYCGQQRDFWHNIEADHFIPLSSPDCTGTIVTNIVPACKTCNASKNDNTVSDWLNVQYGKRKATLILTRIAEYFDYVEKEGLCHE